MLKIQADSLVVGRGREKVAGPLDFELSGGEALIVTGPNGSGKSTLLRTLAGLLEPISGRVAISDANAVDGEPARAVYDVAHYVGHRNAMKPSVTVGDNLTFWRTYLGGRAREGRSRENADALEAVDLPDLSHLPFGYLSAGQQRRVSLARLLVVHRPVWILDEPTSALDAASQVRFGVLMAAHVESGGALIAATHQPLGFEAARELDLQPATPGRDDGEEPDVIAETDIAAAEGWL